MNAASSILTKKQSQILFFAVSMVFSHAYALESMDDHALAEQSGEGIGFVLDNFSMTTPATNGLITTMVGTGYFKELDGSKNYQKPLNLNIRNLQLGATTDNVGISGVQSTTVSGIRAWGTGKDPFALEAYTPTLVTSATGNGLAMNYDASSTNISVLRFVYPTYSTTPAAGSDSNNLKLTMDLTLCNNTSVGTSGGVLCNSGVEPADGTTPPGVYMPMKLRAADFSLNGTQINLFKTASNLPTGQKDTMGIVGVIRYNSDANGYMRLAANATADATSGAGAEGVYLKDIDINLPLGQLFYQPLTIRKGTGNNLVMELTRIPNTPAVYERFYANYTVSNPDPITDLKICNATTCGSTNMPATHGSISIGNVSFQSPTGTVTDLGSAKIDGLLIQHLKLSTTGL